MLPSDDDFSPTTGKIVTRVLTDMAKGVPVLGIMVGAVDSIMQQTEFNRVEAMVEDLWNRMDDTERQQLKEQRRAEIILCAADLIRGDPMAGEKAKFYGQATVKLMRGSEGDSTIVELLESIRKMNAGDFVVLYSFEDAKAQQLEFERIADTQPGYGDQRDKNIQKIDEAFPRVLRLESVGILYRAPELRLGGAMPDFGHLSGELRKMVHLTSTGKRLIDLLPERETKA